MKALLFVLVALLLCTPASAARLDLSPGSDLPTLLGALSPGDEVVLATGAYLLLEPIVLRDIAGTPDSPLVIRGSREGVELVVGPEAGRAFDLRDSSSIWISDLAVRGSEGWEERSQQGVRLRGSTEDVRLERLEIHRLGSYRIRVEGDSDSLAVRRCHLHGSHGDAAILLGCGNGGCQVTAATIDNNWIEGLIEDDGHGIRLLGGNQDAVIIDNVLHDLTGRGVELGPTWFGPANHVERNVMWNVGRGLSVHGTSVVRNNVVIDAAGNGIYVQPGEEGDFEDVVIVSNTVARTGGAAVEIRNQRDNPGFVLANNALANPTGSAVLLPSDSLDDSALIRGNIVTGSVQGLIDTSGHFTPGNGFGDFASPEDRDFYPGPSSSLPDAGWSSSEAWLPPTDFNGVARDEDIDVGAYERSGPANPGWLPVPGFKEPVSTLPIIGTVGCSCEADMGGGGSPGALLLLLLGGYSLGAMGSRSRSTARASR